MNRRKFFTKLLTGAAAIAITPKLLMPKEEVTVMGVKEIPAARESMMKSIATMSISPWGSWPDQDLLAIQKMRKQMQRSMLFGERRDNNRKFYARANGIWSDQIQGKG